LSEVTISIGKAVKWFPKNTILSYNKDNNGKVNKNKTLHLVLSKLTYIMTRGILAGFILFFSIIQANAQLGVMKLVGKNTSNYTIGFGAFLKTAYPVSEGSDVTLEIGADIFFLGDGYGTADGTIMCPLKAGYRYTLNGSGMGFYIEPQAGFNLVGVTSLHDANGNQVNLKYHGAVFAAGTGYLFLIGHTPFDLNLRYETVIDHGGSNNFISLGLTRFISFKKRNTDE
jgi:hypothetical protein